MVLIKKEKKGNIFIYEQDWIQLDCSEQYKNVLYRCIRYIRPEMYFNLIYRIIIEYDYEVFGKEIDDNYVIFEQFKRVSKKILKDYCHILLPKEEVDKPQNSSFNYSVNKILKDYFNISLTKDKTKEQEDSSSFVWKNHYFLYSKQVDVLLRSTCSFINNLEDVQNVLGINKHENPFFSNKSNLFFQNLMYIGYLVALSRIKDEINNKSYLGAEIINYNNETDLVIYLTPEGMSNKSKMRHFTKEETLSWLNIFLENNNMKRIKSESVEIEIDGDSFVHYRLYPGYINDYMSNRINRPHISSILKETQANYVKKDFVQEIE